MIKFPHLLLFSVAVIFSFQAQADQLAWLSREDAAAAAAYFETIDKPVILACYCCPDAEEEWFAYDKVSIKDTGVESTSGKGNYYEVVLSNAMTSHDVDLAYVHVDVHGMRMCVGEILNMPCDPCTEPAWVQKFRITAGFEEGRDISSSLTKVGAHLEMSNRGDMWYMSNVWIDGGSNSHGPIRNIEREEFPENEETYGRDVLEFDWDFVNTYNDKTGTVHVVWTFVYQPEKTAIVIEMNTEEGLIQYTATEGSFRY